MGYRVTFDDSGFYGYPYRSYCPWEAGSGGRSIVPSEHECPRDFEEWITWIVEKFLAPYGTIVNGEVTWYGEEAPDCGKIRIVDNKITFLKGVVTFVDRVELSKDE